MTLRPSSDLRRVQSLFWRLITAPEGVARGAAELRASGELPSGGLSLLVRSDARLDATARLDVYADMYFYRLRDCLAEDYPKLAAWLGEARFHNLVTDFLLAHPPAHFSLRELGRPLAPFLETHALAEEFPGSADLARLEWARADVFDAADAAPLSREHLLEHGATAPEIFRVKRIAALRLLRVAAGTLPLWRQLESGVAAADAPRGAPHGVLVWRRNETILHRSLAPDEDAWLRALGPQGATLAELGERALAEQPGGATPEAAARRLSERLGLWAQDGILTAA